MAAFDGNYTFSNNNRHSYRSRGPEVRQDPSDPEHPEQQMKILVGIDLSVQGHDWLLERAVHVASALDGHVDLVFVSQAPTAEHKALLSGVLTNMLPDSVRGVARIETGDVTDTLIELTNTYDLMIVGPREPTTLHRWLMGPMAVRVLKRSQCPVLVPRRATPFPATPKMLAGVDVKGAAAEQVLVFSQVWAAHLQGTVDAVYAAASHVPTIRNKEMRQVAHREFLASLTVERSALDTRVATLPEAVRGIGRIETGEPEDVLVRLSREYDIILVGNRGRTRNFSPSHGQCGQPCGPQRAL